MIQNGMSIVDQILASPTAIKDIEEARELLMAEQRMREKFREDITEEQKWEFINGQVILHSPAKHRHLVATQHLMKLVGTFVAHATSLVKFTPKKPLWIHTQRL